MAFTLRTMQKTLLLSLLPFLSCKNKTENLQNIIISIQHEVQFADAITTDTVAYKKLKANIAAKIYRKSHFHLIVDSLAPYWYGTPWNFYGTTQLPLYGKIACGYFVTTLVRDAGIPVQRVHLAQQAASKIITTLCKSSSIQSFSNKQKMIDYFTKYPNNTLFIIGLDCHVGFVTKENNKLYFLHSSYVAPAVVKKELLLDAVPINSSKTWMLGLLE
jgi:hypothetical protein